MNQKIIVIGCLFTLALFLFFSYVKIDLLKLNSTSVDNANIDNISEEVENINISKLKASEDKKSLFLINDYLGEGAIHKFSLGDQSESIIRNFKEIENTNKLSDVSKFAEYDVYSIDSFVSDGKSFYFSINTNSSVKIFSINPIVNEVNLIWTDSKTNPKHEERGIAQIEFDSRIPAHLIIKRKDCSGCEIATSTPSVILLNKHTQHTIYIENFNSIHSIKNERLSYFPNIINPVECEENFLDCTLRKGINPRIEKSTNILDVLLP